MFFDDRSVLSKMRGEPCLAYLMIRVLLNDINKIMKAKIKCVSAGANIGISTTIDLSIEGILVILISKDW